MSTTEQIQEQRLEADIEHLKEEIATIELTSAHATGTELQNMLADQQELRDTMTNKYRQLRALRNENSNQWNSIVAMALLLLLACCTPKLSSLSHHDKEVQAPVAMKGGLLR